MRPIDQRFSLLCRRIPLPYRRPVPTHLNDSGYSPFFSKGKSAPSAYSELSRARSAIVPTKKIILKAYFIH